MKALEKAAKDRGEVRTEPAAVTAAAETKPELSLALELLAADTPSPRLAEEPPPRPALAQRAGGATPPQGHASTLLQAGDSGGGIAAYVRSYPLVAFGTVAALFAVGFGAYVYLQIFHPGLFVRQPPVAPKPPAPLAQLPAPAAPSPAPTAPEPLPAAPLLQSRVREAPSPPPATTAATPKPAPAPPKTESALPRNTIAVSRGSAAPAVSPLLTEAYDALQAGRLDAAQRAYADLARGDPKSIDALLGLASIALQQGRTEDASKHYMAILELDPRHALAQSGLIGLIGRADPLAAETRLKQLIAREPSAFLHFTLGNLYADQSLWAQAQQAYFQAHLLEPNNPDYAYNLAVGLEHLGQHKLALGFYRRAAQLASTRGYANFNLAQAQERISKLASQVE